MHDNNTIEFGTSATKCHNNTGHGCQRNIFMHCIQSTVFRIAKGWFVLFLFYFKYPFSLDHQNRWNDFKIKQKTANMRKRNGRCSPNDDVILVKSNTQHAIICCYYCFICMKKKNMRGNCFIYRFGFFSLTLLLLAFAQRKWTNARERPKHLYLFRFQSEWKFLFRMKSEHRAVKRIIFLVRE